MRTWSFRNNHGQDKVLEICQGDITKQNVDAIVNAANPYLAGGGGVDGAIHRAAGPKLMDLCRDVTPDKAGVRCPVGHAVITEGCDLPAPYVIHTAGPVWHGGHSGEPEQLASCHRQCLELAASKSLKSVAFPAISCGIYGYPVHEAADIAIRAILEHLRSETGVERVHYVLFADKDRVKFEAALSKWVSPSGRFPRS